MIREWRDGPTANASELVRDLMAATALGAAPHEIVALWS
jgi:hypothetical protein